MSMSETECKIRVITRKDYIDYVESIKRELNANIDKRKVKR